MRVLVEMLDTISENNIETHVKTVLQKREYPRVAFTGHVRLKLNGRERQFFIARDLSLGGLSFYCDEQLQLPVNGHRVEVSFQPPSRFIDDVFDSKCRLTAEIVSKRGDKSGSKRYVAVKFDKDLKAAAGGIYKSRIRKTSLLIPVIVLLILLLKKLNVDYYWYHPLANLYSLTVTAYLLSRFVIAFFYSPPACEAGYAPAVTVVIPVKNDDKIIARAVERCYLSNYPKDRLEVIVVNDGSTDRTMEEIKKVKSSYPELAVIDLKINRGKRCAMAEGARAAKGDILVYIDSDSLIGRDSLKYIVQGFSDPKVGAVSGHANVLNGDDNLLSRMQEVRYYLAFRVSKAAEHRFSAVSCCSGTLSAYRKSYLMKILDKWLNQKFLGAAATLGDDRSLTSFILKKYRVLYDCRATVETVVPVRWGEFFKQQLRWKKSWFRESVIAAGFIWRKHPAASAAFYAAFALPLISPLIVLNAFIYRPLFLGQPPAYYLFGFCLMSLLYSFYYLLKRPNNKWIYGICFCLLYMIALSWQTYYAVITCRRNHWGTR